MKSIRRRLTYANVMSSLAVFLVLGGATAFAASQLPRNSVGTKQLKNNAVITKKIKKNAVSRAKIRKGAINTARLKGSAVTTAKIKKDAVTGAKIKANAVTGAKIDAGTTPFSQVTARLRNAATVPFGSESPVFIGSFSQPAGELDQLVGEVAVTFAPTCTGKRSAIVYLVLDPPDPNNMSPSDIAGFAATGDATGGTVTNTAGFVPFPEGGRGMQSFESTTTATHYLYAYAVKENCEGGSGVTASNFAVDVIGTR